MFYQQHAWKKLEDKIKNLKKDGVEEVTIDLIEKLMNEVSSQAYKNHKKPTGEEMAKIFSDFANNFSCDEEGFINKVTTEHRTLQQSMFKIFMLCVERWSSYESKGYYDLRNEQTVKLSKEIMEKTSLESCKGIPMI